jgi:hypothetical protein
MSNKSKTLNEAYLIGVKCGNAGMSSAANAFRNYEKHTGHYLQWREGHQDSLKRQIKLGK